ncbi:MAG: SDR family NAD(P)-dependent oxidoreductase, partial [Acidimicrobiia bacterium]
MEKTVVITGGTGGLGTSLVRRLQAEDFRLAITYLLPDEATSFENEFEVDEDRILLTRVDATNPEAVATLFKDISESWGPIHGVCSLVGGWAGGRDVEETDDIRLERMLDLNLRSAFYTVRAAIPYLKETGWGRIVLVGSRGAVDCPEGQAAF